MVRAPPLPLDGKEEAKGETQYAYTVAGSARSLQNADTRVLAACVETAVAPELPSMSTSRDAEEELEDDEEEEEEGTNAAAVDDADDGAAEGQIAAWL